MKRRDVVFLVLGVVLSFSLGLGRSTASAQSRAVSATPVPSTTIITTPEGKVLYESSEPGAVLSGNDLAFKIDHTRDGRVVGTLMVKVAGKWKPAELSSINALAR